MTTLGEFIGSDLEENFASFDITEVQQVLANLADGDPIDLAHAEQLQQQTLRAADLLIEYLGKLTKSIGYYETRVNSVKNKASLDYQAKEGKTTTDMKIWAGNCAPEVEEIQIKLARAKASKLVLEKKYDVVIKSHHYYKELTMGMRRGVLGYNNSTSSNEDIPEGYR
jgi:hypothetical protein